MINKGGSRWCDLAQDVVHRADDQCGDAVAFYNVGDETDGLMAERSVRDEQGEVDFRCG
jgi:hypothetical protein